MASLASNIDVFPSIQVGSNRLSSLSSLFLIDLIILFHVIIKIVIITEKLNEKLFTIVFNRILIVLPSPPKPTKSKLRIALLIEYRRHFLIKYPKTAIVDE